MSSTELCAACAQPLAYPMVGVPRRGARLSYHLDCYEPQPAAEFILPGEPMALSWAREAYANTLGLIAYWEQCGCSNCLLDQSDIDARSIALDLLVAQAHSAPARG